MTSSSSWTSEKPLPTSPSSNFSSSTTDLSVSLNLRARQDSQGSISGLLAEDGGETMKMLKTLVEKAKEKGEKEVTVSVESLEILIGEAGKGREKYVSLKGKYDGIKRASARYIEGLTVASDDYEKEVSARREVETEVKRLRAQMHGQTARLSLMDADLKRQDSMQRRSRELVKDMQGLEKDLSKLRAERDLTLAEVEELSTAKSSGNGHQSSLSRSLSTRLEVVKEQYREELEPLTAERERLTREINELREARETYLEESTTLNARNEELSDLQASLLRQVETAEDALSRAQRQGRSPSLSSLPTSATLHEVPEEVAKYVKVVKPETMEPAPAIRKFKWYKSSKGPESSSTRGKQPSSQVLGMVNGKGGKVLYDGGATSGNLGSSSGAGGGGTGKEHVFMQHNIPTLRFTRCDHCGDKMWGPIQELRCAGCGSNCHSKCAPQYDRPCNSSSAALPSLDESGGDAGPPPPSMFGRDLTEQAEADGEAIPVIVRKCIAAVDAVGMEYEGIYRKTGGSSQSKHITQLFERGDYDAFDLSDQDTFNDISSVTSVLKNYFRALPDPLLTHEFHEQFVGAAMIRDLDAKRAALLPLVRQLPKAHFDTLRYLMLHLNRVMALQKENLMSARNLGVVFGPTLMRSADRSREFGDMAGKALAIDWLVEHAQEAFAPQQDPEA
ncbi:hypothetical protein BDY24DRAFT_338178 [Mrakia frigida]|uniref:uncharacterized protein n=1 Tax=Mrakia frigida TaxID=29902 RepID=UPI003FCC24CA